MSFSDKRDVYVVDTVSHDSRSRRTAGPNASRDRTDDAAGGAQDPLHRPLRPQRRGDGRSTGHEAGRAAVRGTAGR